MLWPSVGGKKLKHNRPGDKCMILKQEHNNMGLIMLEKGKKKFLHAVQSHLKSEVFLTVVNGHTITTYIFRQSLLESIHYVQKTKTVCYNRPTVAELGPNHTFHCLKHLSSSSTTIKYCWDQRMKSLVIVDFKMESELNSVSQNSLVSTPRRKDCEETQLWTIIGQGDRPVISVCTWCGNFHYFFVFSYQWNK